MKRLVMLVALIGCKKAEEAAPAPAPPAPAPAPTPVEKAPPAKACVIKVSIDHDTVAFDNGSGVKGTTTTDAMDFSELTKGLVCPATVVATDDTSYQVVIRAMDRLGTVGIVDIGLGDGKPHRPMAPPVGPLLDGGLRQVPVITIAKDKVSLSGKEIAKTTDSGLAIAITNALPAHPTDPTVILQADQSLPYSIIKDAIAGATTAGYDNLLFAVKNK